MSDNKKAKLVLVDDRVVADVRHQLLPFAERVEGFRSEGATYNAVSCHPDVFIHQGTGINTLAPNTPTPIINHFRDTDIPFRLGKANIGSDLLTSTPYNCIATSKSLLHKSGFTDVTILEENQHLSFINLPQAYTRCTTLVIRDGVAVTSDNGVQKALISCGWDVLYFDPSEIRIEDHKNGFFGGCCGIWNNTIFTLGNPLLHSDGELFKEFIAAHGFELHPLSDTKLYDGGGILFF